MKRILLLIAVCLLVTSCNHFKQIVEKPVYIHDTLTSYLYQHDSIMLHDSTFVLLKGDTVYIDRTHTEYRYKLIHDTTSVVKEIPVEVTTTEIKEVEKPLNWLEKTMIGLGVCMLITIAVVAVRWYIKKKTNI